MSRPLRWPWWVTGFAAALWLLLSLAMLLAQQFPGEVPPATIVAGGIALALAAPVAIIALAALQLRQTGAARADRTARIAEAAWLADHRLDEAGQLLTRFEARFAVLIDQMQAMATGSTALDAATEAANAAGTRLEAIIPAAAAQAETLRRVLSAAETDLQRQLGDTETLLAALWTRTAELTAQMTSTTAAAAETINAVTSAAATAGAALGEPLAALEAASTAALARNAAAAAATRETIDANAALLAASVAAASHSLHTIGNAATTRAAAHVATLEAAAAQLTTEISRQADRYHMFIEQLERGFATLDGRLVASVASSKAGLDTVAIGMVAARDAVNGLAMPINATQAALAAVEGQVANVGAATTTALAALSTALPAATPQVAAMTTALAALHANAAGLAAPITASTAAIADATAAVVAAHAGLDSVATKVTGELVTARTIVADIEAMAGSSTLAAAAQLADVFGRVRDVARQTAGTMRESLADVITEAETALESAGKKRAENAFAAPVRAALADLADANSRAADSAQAAAERITGRLLALTGTIANVESRLAAAEDAQDSRLRADIAARSATLLASMDAAAIDISALMLTDIDEGAWGKWLGGERGLFVRRAVRLLDSATARSIAGLWQADSGFRELATRYIGEFEALIARVMPEREGRSLALALLSSDPGKLYAALTQATGRAQPGW
jgi:hypothetical protein